MERCGSRSRPVIRSGDSCSFLHHLSPTPSRPARSASSTFRHPEAVSPGSHGVPTARSGSPSSRRIALDVSRWLAPLRSTRCPHREALLQASQPARMVHCGSQSGTATGSAESRRVARSASSYCPQRSVARTGSPRVRTVLCGSPSIWGTASAASRRPVCSLRCPSRPLALRPASRPARTGTSGLPSTGVT